MRKVIPLFKTVIIAFIFLFVIGIPNCQAETTAVFHIGQAQYTAGSKTVIMDTAPYIKDSRTFLPLRYAANAVGVSDENILWDAILRQVTIYKDNRTIKLSVGSRELVVDGAGFEMDTEPEIVKDRLMLPVYWLARALDVDIQWDSATQSVIITCPSKGEVGKQNVDAVAREYTWHDPSGRKQTIKVSIPQELYQYYSKQPRIHEQILDDFNNQIQKLIQDTERLKRQFEQASQELKITPADSYAEAWRKYLEYLEMYQEVNQKLYEIQQKYYALLKLYKQANYREMLDGYVPYATEEANYKLVRQIAQALSDKLQAKDKARIEFVAGLVQEAIPYVSEEGEYPKYPVETLIEGGDCEDKSILLASLLRAMGYRSALLLFRGNPGHMAVGVECSDGWGSYYLKDGVKYFYLESTNSGWKVGQIPPDVKNVGAVVYPLP